MTNEQAIATRNTLNGYCSRYHGSYCQTLFDPHQTHAIYGIEKANKDKVKRELKELGAKKFRMVQPGAKYLIIICFDASNIK